MNDFFLNLSAAYVLFHFIHKRAECPKYNLRTKTFCISVVNKDLLMISKKVEIFQRLFQLQLLY